MNTYRQPCGFCLTVTDGSATAAWERGCRALLLMPLQKGSRGLVLQGISAQSASFKKTPKDVKNKVAVGWQDSFHHASPSGGA